MYDSGIKDILYIYNADSYSGKKKLDGFRMAMQSYNSPNYEKMICRIPDNITSMEATVKYIEKFAKSCPSFKGVITADDFLGIATVKYAQKYKLSIPDDLSIISYNNSMLTDCCTPELTSIDNQLETLTKALVRTLVGVLDGQEMPQKTVFSGTLVKRGTTKF